MNILLFSYAPAYSDLCVNGPTIWSQAFIRMMRKRRHRVYVVTYAKKCNVMKCPEYSIDLLTIDCDDFFANLSNKVFAGALNIFKAGKQASQLMKNMQIDAIICTTIHESAAFYIYNTKIPVVVINHGYYPFELNREFNGKTRIIRMFTYNLMEKMGTKVISGAVYPSKWLKEQLKDRVKVNGYIMRNPLRKIGNEEQIYTKKEYKIKSIPKVISYNNLNTSYKREAFDIYIDVVKLIINLLKDIEFIVLGVNYNCVEYAKMKIGGLPIKIISKTDNVYKIMSDADLYLHISLIDTFSMTTLEAMSVGLPVIATKNAALPELIDEGKTGILVNNEPENIAKEIMGMIQNREMASKLGNAAKKYVEDNSFDEESISCEWECLLYSVIKKSKNNICIH